MENKIEPLPAFPRGEQIHRVKDAGRSDASLNIILNHLNSFQKNDLVSLLSDYTDESILITQEAVYSGLSRIAAFFKEFIVHFPIERSNFEMDKIVVENELAYIVWHCKTPTLEVLIGSDTFILKEGKIYQQTFVGQMKLVEL